MPQSSGGGLEGQWEAWQVTVPHSFLLFLLFTLSLFHASYRVRYVVNCNWLICILCLSGSPQHPSCLFFQYNTQLGPPYHILVDTNFINFSIKAKLDLVQSMMDCLYAKCECLHHLQFLLEHMVLCFISVILHHRAHSSWLR